MADDCANVWGTRFVFILGQRGSSLHNKRNQQIMFLRDDDGFERFKRLTMSTLGGDFVLEKVTVCGSDAQVFALMQASQGDFDSVYIACGSYVSGTNGGLQNWTSSKFDVQCGPCTVALPTEIESEFTRNHTIALPYHIPNSDLSTEQLHAYEDDCLNELHLRLLTRRIQKRPMKVLLMELLLAGCGAILSDRALKKLAALANHHGFSIVLDEIMTGGRTGSMLLVQQKPLEFKQVVKYITMGKFLSGGLVLISNNELIRRGINDDADVTSSTRGSSSKLDCHNMIIAWETVFDRVNTTDARRGMVLTKFGFNPAECWGKGNILFTPHRRSDSAGGLKNRLLPMLEAVPVDNIRFKKYFNNNAWSKENVNSKAILRVKAWVSYRPTDVADVKFAEATRSFAEHLLRNRIQPGHFQIKKDITIMFAKSVQTRTAKDIARLALDAKVFKWKRKFKERIEMYIFENICIPPWYILKKKSAIDEESDLITLPGGCYVGDRVLVSRERTLKNGDVNSDVMASGSHALDTDDNLFCYTFGTIAEYLPKKKNGPEKWRVVFERKREVIVLQSVLEAMIHQYRKYSNRDTCRTRFIGTKVIKTVYGSSKFEGTVYKAVQPAAKKVNDENAINGNNGILTMLIKYSDELSEWVTEAEYYSMRSAWKRAKFTQNNNKTIK